MIHKYAVFHLDFDEFSDEIVEEEIENTAMEWLNKGYAKDEPPDDCISSCGISDLMIVTYCFEEPNSEFEDNVTDKPTAGGYFTIVAGSWGDLGERWIGK